VQFKAEKAGVVHAGIGKASFDAAKLAENLRAFVDAVNKAKPAGAKGTYVKRVAISSTMGPFTNAGSVVVAHYAGLTVAQMNDLRSRMRSAGGTVKVAKNRLAKIALQGTESEGVADLFDRPDAHRILR
jgi:hypothetical protein